MLTRNSTTTSTCNVRKGEGERTVLVQDTSECAIELGLIQ